MITRALFVRLEGEERSGGGGRVLLARRRDPTIERADVLAGKVDVAALQPQPQ